MTTLERIKEQCEKARENTAILETWAADRPWLNEADLYYTVPSVAQIRVESNSRSMLAFHLGSAGWSYNGVDTISKTVDGVEVQIAHRASVFAPVSIEEMQK